MNYEACCGAIALKKYFDTLSAYDVECAGVGPSRGDVAESAIGRQTSHQITSESSNESTGGTSSRVNKEGDGGGSIGARKDASTLNMARMRIQQVESRLLRSLLGYLEKCAPLVRIVQDVGQMKVTQRSSEEDAHEELQRIPIVCFTHANISSRAIVRHCRKHGVVCRACTFLSTTRLWNELGIKDESGGVVRFSLAHYNTLDEIDSCVRILEMLW